jgi:FkbM family methyltransferase
MHKKRLPTIYSSIQALLNEGMVIETVIDIGVLKCTDYLKSMFPDAFHHLFEPLREYSTEIKKNYSAITHKHYPVALSAESGETYQVGISRDQTGQVTHSFLSATYVVTGSNFSGAPVISCVPIEKKTLDGCFSSEKPAGHYLVKIDVDGHELPIIDGGENVISGADLVIVEATMTTLIDRAVRLRGLGQNLVDIVDLCYYHEMLSQVDLIFASDDLLRRVPDIRPWGRKPFSNEAWVTLNHQLTSLPHRG